MEEDIRILEEFITDYENTTDPLEQNCYFEEVPIAEIKSIVARSKQQEKIIDSMVEYIDKNTYRDDEGCEFENLVKVCNENCKECIKEYFEKKASRNDEPR